MQNENFLTYLQNRTEPHVVPFTLRDNRFDVTFQIDNIPVMLRQDSDYMSSHSREFGTAVKILGRHTVDYYSQMQQRIVSFREERFLQGKTFAYTKNNETHMGLIIDVTSGSERVEANAPREKYLLAEALSLILMRLDLYAAILSVPNSDRKLKADKMAEAMKSYDPNIHVTYPPARIGTYRVIYNSYKHNAAESMFKYARDNGMLLGRE